MIQQCIEETYSSIYEHYMGQADKKIYLFFGKCMCVYICFIYLVCINALTKVQEQMSEVGLVLKDKKK